MAPSDSASETSAESGRSRAWVAVCSQCCSAAFSRCSALSATGCRAIRRIYAGGGSPEAEDAAVELKEFATAFLADDGKSGPQQGAYAAAAQELRRNLAGIGFEAACATSTELSLVGEITSFSLHDCSSDEEDSLADEEAEALWCSTTAVPLWTLFWRPSFFIVYEVSLPTGGTWEVVSNGTGGVMGNEMMCTQYATLSGHARARREYLFNQPLQLHLARHWQPEVPPPAGVLPADPIPPRLLLQVLSVDSWGRHQLHGYGFVDLPREPGNHRLKTRLWAPLGTIRQQLSAEFCGTYLPLASPHLLGTTDAHTRDLLPRNRSALRAQTAPGFVRVQLAVIRRGPDMYVPHKGHADVSQLPAGSPRTGVGPMTSSAMPTVSGEGVDSEVRRRRRTPGTAIPSTYADASVTQPDGARRDVPATVYGRTVQ